MTNKKSLKLFFVLLLLLFANNNFAQSDLKKEIFPQGLKPLHTLSQFMPFSFWQVQVPTDPCIGGNPTIGTSCSSGAVYAGIFDGGKYMITPGDCTDSATPTCDDTADSLTKNWRGTSGSNVDIAGVENVSSNTIHSSPSFRGDVNTAAIVADASISSDSAADYCNDMTYAGYTDWYLPSKSELIYLLCKGDLPFYGNSSLSPQEAPGCTQFGGRTNEITGFQTGAWYLSSTEDGSDNRWRTLSDWLNTGSSNKNNLDRVRCVRRYEEGLVDEVPDALSWSDFNDESTTETISGFDETIFLEFSAVNGTGTPTLGVQINSNNIKTFDSTAPLLVAVRPNDTIQFSISGGLAESATITIKNATDDATTPTLDTVVATVLDLCAGGNPAIGTTCGGGSIYAGQFDGGKYMVTPGNCTDSATPTCDGGSDTLNKIWRGSAGSNVDIVGVETVSFVEPHSLHSSPSFRGDVNTAAIVADASVSSDSGADYCNDMTYGGYSDWYLPSKSELTYIFCKSNMTNHELANPQEAPDCVQFGGETDDLGGFISGWYLSSTERDFSGQQVWMVYNLNNYPLPKSGSSPVRCVRRYGETAVDEAPDFVFWASFNDRSTAETLTGFDGTIFLEFSAVNGTGTPTLEARVVGTDLWRPFSDGSPNLLAVRSGDQVEIKIEGTIGHSATVTIKNATDNTAKPTLGTVVATVSDQCINNPAIGTTCSGGAIYAGIFDGGKYMVTPGDCTDSATPTCDGTTDSLDKSWNGSGGSNADIAGVENLGPNEVLFSSPSFRGGDNTAAIVADVSNGTNSAADYCNDMTYGGYSDWYLPSSAEMLHIYCKSDASSPELGFPEPDPACTQYGGKTTDLSGFDSEQYWTSTERSSTNAKIMNFSTASSEGGAKSSLANLRCVRRYDESDVDISVVEYDPWNFTDESYPLSVDGFDETIFFEFSASNNSGTPTIILFINDEEYKAFTGGDTILAPVRSGDVLKYQIVGNVTDSADITIKHATDDATTPTFDTITGTVGDTCFGTPSIGTSCSGGSIYAGIFDGGKYMVTPGDCTDSSTPTCDGTTDTLQKYWRGSTGSNSDIASVETQSGQSTFSSPSFRGDVNTPLIVDDASVSADSAADYCNDMDYGGYTDWYLPSKNELVYLACKSNGTTGVSPYPDTDVNCTQHGGATNDLDDFETTGLYLSSTEQASDRFAGVWFSNSNISDSLKATQYYIRCVRRYQELAIDIDVNNATWANFTGSSTSETINGFDETVFLELTAVNTVGTPTLQYNLNSSGFTTFTAGTSTLIAVRSGDTLQFQVTGTSTHQAIITVRIATDDKTSEIRDNITGTVP